jgi:hypothetical protein
MPLHLESVAAAKKSFTHIDHAHAAEPGGGQLQPASVVKKIPEDHDVGIITANPSAQRKRAHTGLSQKWKVLKVKGK